VERGVWGDEKGEVAGKSVVIQREMNKINWIFLKINSFNTYPTASSQLKTQVLKLHMVPFSVVEIVPHH
jgi:hypothetical protein